MGTDGEEMEEGSYQNHERDDESDLFLTPLTTDVEEGSHGGNSYHIEEKAMKVDPLLSMQVPYYEDDKVLAALRMAHGKRQRNTDVKGRKLDTENETKRKTLKPSDRHLDSLLLVSRFTNTYRQYDDTDSDHSQQKKATWHDMLNEFQDDESDDSNLLKKYRNRNTKSMQGQGQGQGRKGKKQLKLPTKQKQKQHKNVQTNRNRASPRDVTDVPHSTCSGESEDRSISPSLHHHLYPDEVEV